MKESTRVLLWRLEAEKLEPSVVSHRVFGKTMATWYVDDDDDRYVEMTDAVHSDNVVLVAWDGFPAASAVSSGWPVEAIVLWEPDEIARWISQKLAVLKSSPSPRGRPGGLANCLPPEAYSEHP
jgi:hypothetical protein